MTEDEVVSGEEMEEISAKVDIADKAIQDLDVLYNAHQQWCQQAEFSDDQEHVLFSALVQLYIARMK